MSAPADGGGNGGSRGRVGASAGGSGGGGGGGLVKKLLFPSYADSGASETFLRPSPRSLSSSPARVGFGGGGGLTPDDGNEDGVVDAAGGGEYARSSSPRPPPPQATTATSASPALQQQQPTLPPPDPTGMYNPRMYVRHSVPRSPLPPVRQQQRQQQRQPPQNSQPQRQSGDGIGGGRRSGSGHSPTTTTTTTTLASMEAEGDGQSGGDDRVDLSLDRPPGVDESLLVHSGASPANGGSTNRALVGGIVENDVDADDADRDATAGSRRSPLPSFPYRSPLPPSSSSGAAAPALAPAQAGTASSPSEREGTTDADDGTRWGPTSPPSLMRRTTPSSSSSSPPLPSSPTTTHATRDASVDLALSTTASTAALTTAASSVLGYHFLVDGGDDCEEVERRRNPLATVRGSSPHPDAAVEKEAEGEKDEEDVVATDGGDVEVALSMSEEEEEAKAASSVLSDGRHRDDAHANNGERDDKGEEEESASEVGSLVSVMGSVDGDDRRKRMLEDLSGMMESLNEEEVEEEEQETDSGGRSGDIMSSIEATAISSTSPENGERSSCGAKKSGEDGAWETPIRRPNGGSAAASSDLSASLALPTLGEPPFGDGNDGVRKDDERRRADGNTTPEAAGGSSGGVLSSGSGQAHKASTSSSSMGAVSAAIRMIGSGIGAVASSTGRSSEPPSPMPRHGSVSPRPTTTPPSQSRSPSQQGHQAAIRHGSSTPQQVPPSFPVRFSSSVPAAQHHGRFHAPSLHLSPRFSASSGGGRSPLTPRQQQQPLRTPARSFDQATMAATTPSSWGGGAGSKKSGPLTSPLRIGSMAKKCFSFDETASGIGASPYVGYRTNLSPPTSPMPHGGGVREWPRSGGRGGASRQQQSRHPRSPNPRSLLRSRSWDVASGGASDGRTDPMSSAGGFSSPQRRLPGFSPATAGAAFRGTTTTRIGGGGDGIRSFQRRSPGTNQQQSPAHATAEQYSPSISRKRDSAVPLQSAQRIEIEREDALDILSCLVERTVAFQGKTGEASTVTTKGDNDGVDAGESSVGGKPETSKNSIFMAKTDGESSLRTVAKDKENSSERPRHDGVPEYTSTEAVNTLLKTDLPKLGAARRSSNVSAMSEAIEALRIISRDYELKRSRDSPGKTIRVGQRPDENSKDVPDHDTRMEALDELTQSHTYALEMERAALSASAWLKSIGRSTKTKEVNATATTTTLDNGGPDVNKGKASGVPLTYSLSASSAGAKSPTSSPKSDKTALATSSSNVDISVMDVVSMRAMLHALQLQNAEKNKNIQRLDEELSKCRAEIGRLKSAARAEALFTSPNRSIFDDESTTSSDASADELENVTTTLGELSPVPETTRVELGSRGEIGNENSTTNVNTNMNALRSAADAKRQVVVLKAALEKSNRAVRELQCSSTNNDTAIAANKREDTEVPEDSTSGATPLPCPQAGDEKEATNGGQERQVGMPDTIDISNPVLEEELEAYKEAIRQSDMQEINTLRMQLEALRSKIKNKSIKNKGDLARDSPGNIDRRMIHVRMLDAENFVTEWDELNPPLPPPPDHGLRSPIVDTLLAQWTSDQNLHSSLLSWMDKILDTGTDPDLVPPLTISNLDHQVRDGFTMHVLPLLLRRSDIHVQVTTRAHRQTTYDMSVSVRRPVQTGNGTLALGDSSMEGIGDNIFLPDGNQSMEQSANTSLFAQSARSRHMMAFQASRSGNSMIEEAGDDNEGRTRQQFSTKNASAVRGKVTDLLRGSSNKQASEAGSNSSAITSQISNRVLHRLDHSSEGEAPSLSVARQRLQAPGRAADERHQPKHAQDQLWDEIHPSGISVRAALVGDEHSVGSSITGGSSQRSSQQPGLMSTIGGAFGGLLSRRKAPHSTHQSSSFDNEDWHDSSPSIQNSASQPMSKPTSQNLAGSLPPDTGNNMGLFSSPHHDQMFSHIPASPHDDGVTENQLAIRVPPHLVGEEEDQPYHRVVSAPPGRIGVTFVEYRGHAMVSDVSPESPLSGWVFPSDILIAIDEVPVSGLRIREIVKLLTARKDRQRALRMISSHAMTDFLHPVGADAEGR